MFTIQCHTTEGRLIQTPLAQASAAVLAMKWQDEGHADVEIEHDGQCYDLETFRQRFLLQKPLRQQAQIGV